MPVIFHTHPSACRIGLTVKLGADCLSSNFEFLVLASKLGFPPSRTRGLAVQLNSWQIWRCMRILALGLWLALTVPKLAAYHVLSAAPAPRGWDAANIT